MKDKNKQASEPDTRHNLSKVLPEFNAAMRKIIEVSKEEVAPREQAERAANESSK